MTEYIEREAAIAIIEEKQKELCPVGMYSRHAVYGSDREKFDAWQEIIDMLESIYAADVRPVVLCRDCLHYEMGVCLKIYDDGAANKDAWQERKPEDFCSYGEKREES